MIVPELLGEDEALVGQANALFQGATRITMLLGPVLGGVLIAAVSRAVGARRRRGDLRRLGRARAHARAATRRRCRPSEDVGVRRGLRFLVREPLLRLWVPLFALGDTAWTAFFVSIPVLVVTRFDADPRDRRLAARRRSASAPCSATSLAYRFLLGASTG